MKFKLLNCLSTTAFMLALASCGGSSSGGSSAGGSSSGLSGVAATGAPMAKASVFIVDSNGKNGVSVKTADDGSYTISISDLAAPFLIKVIGTDGKTLMSSASEEDVQAKKKVNVTPLTHVITSNVVGNGDANKMFEAFKNKASLLTKVNLDSQKNKLKEKLKAAGIFSGLSVSEDIDILNGELNAGTGAGMDKVLDAIKVDVAEEGAVIAPKSDPSNSFSDNLTDDSADTDMTTYTPTTPTKLESANTLMTELKTTMTSINTTIANFGTDKDSAHAAVRDNLIHDDFLHNGVGGLSDGAWYMLCDGLTDADSTSDNDISSSDCTNYEGGDMATASFKNLNIEKIYDADGDGVLKEAGDYVDVTYDWYDDGEFDGKETDRFAWDASDSKWKWIGNGSKYKVYFESLSKKETSVTFSSPTNSVATNKYTAGLNMYVPSGGAPADGSVYMEVSGPGIGDGSTPKKVVYNSSMSTFVFEDIQYLDADGVPTATPNYWDSPTNSVPRYNYRSNFINFDESRIKEMNLINDYTISFKKTADDSADGSLVVSLTKPVLLTAENESHFIVELEEPSAYCAAPPTAIHGTVPNGIELVNADMNYYIHHNTNGARSFNLTNGNDISIKGEFSQNTSFNGDAEMDAQDIVYNMNAFMWLEDTYDRNYSIEFSCNYDPSL
ncbi:hypothetical protein BIY24_01980 [Halobacteriovorax marinus]|uniref:carboxypeptidase-like regulatory domain-containing protein n=1 Tax=Halobacteriovorax marinus TaxID=97084 RepID=UPI000BC334B2|nr:carboxypeptidase-like regulatory domain-containing protein [Halobacteriovorax marinus]ATH06750.1 hypothetical protein BIY24_01980 [Halobacteriovorax marinus]